MAKRRTRKQNNGSPLAFLGALIVVGAVMLINAQPAFGIVVAVMVVAGAGIWIKVLQQRQVQARQQHAIQVTRSQQVALYHQMSPKEFEHALAFLCRRDGCTNVRVVGGAGDLGADVIANAPDGRLIVLQAKRYGPTTKVSGPDLQKFGGTCFNVHHAQVAAVVTTSVFTRQAREYAGHMGIRLFDLQALGGWASRTGPAPWR